MEAFHSSNRCRAEFQTFTGRPNNRTSWPISDYLLLGIHRVCWFFCLFPASWGDHLKKLTPVCWISCTEWCWKRLGLAVWCPVCWVNATWCLSSDLKVALDLRAWLKRPSVSHRWELYYLLRISFLSSAKPILCSDFVYLRLIPLFQAVQPVVSLTTSWKSLASGMSIDLNLFKYSFLRL